MGQELPLVAVHAEVLQACLRHGEGELDNSVVIEEIKTMDAIRDQSIAAQRFAMTLIAAFALVALALAVVGLYGVMSHAVAQRSHEIGIRMAIGAQRHHVLRMILRQGALLAGKGFAHLPLFVPSHKQLARRIAVQ